MAASDDYIILNELNDGEKLGEPVVPEGDRDPFALAKSLQRLMAKLKGEHLVDEKQVDYASLVKSELFSAEYVQLARSLKSVDLGLLLGRDENLLAFFINVYNALTIHALAHLHQTDALLASPDAEVSLVQNYSYFWGKMAYRIGEHVFSLDDIEHGILRANKIHPSSKKQFFDETTDVRVQFKCKAFNPNIHFALNCGAKGCPPISFYMPESVISGLERAARAFCSNETTVSKSTGDDEKQAYKVEVSRLFLWYKSDFTSSVELATEDEDLKLLAFIRANMDAAGEAADKCRALDEVLRGEAKFEVVFSTYNWAINRK